MAKQPLNGQMDLGNAHRPPGRRQYLDDGSLDHPVAQTPQRWLGDRSAQFSRSQRRGRLRLEHSPQGRRRVRELSYQAHTESPENQAFRR